MPQARELAEETTDEGATMSDEPCGGCEADRSTERACIDGSDLPESSAPHTCEAMLDILFVPASMFLRIPQVGKPLTMTFSQLAGQLSKPMVGERKDIGGAYSPALYRENVRRKSSIVHVCVLVIDIDEGGIVEKLAGVFGKRRAIIHSTFSSTPEAPRCRVLLELEKPINTTTYDRLHSHMRATLLEKFNVIADNGAKDPSRLSYYPVVRKGVEQTLVQTYGARIDGVGIVARQPPLLPPPPPKPIEAKHRDRYINGALQDAANAIAHATPGMRHAELAKEAWGLARLDLTEAEIALVLVPAFVACAGEPRRAEAVRTIRDQFNDRNGRT